MLCDHVVGAAVCDKFMVTDRKSKKLYSAGLKSKVVETNRNKQMDQNWAHSNYKLLIQGMKSQQSSVSESIFS